MKHCPNCEKKIRRKKITELNPLSDLIKCKNCGAIIKTNKFYLFHKNAVVDWIGMILIVIGLDVFDSSVFISIIIITIGLGLYLFGLRRYLRSVKLNVLAVADPEPVNIFTGKKGKCSEKDEIESYKKQFKLWSEQRLGEVLEIKRWSRAAKIAAEQLLKDKTKI